MPRAADTVGFVEASHCESEFVAKFVQGVDAGESGTDDDRVQ